MIMVMSMTTLFVMLILAFSARNVIHGYYIERQESIYLPYDITMETDQNTNARFFSITQLIQYKNTHEDIKSYVPFFETQMLISANNQESYVKLFAGELSYLRVLVDKLDYVHLTLGPSDVMVTKSFAEQNELSINQSIELWIGSQTKTYQIVEIIPDQSLFREHSIFVGKTSIIRAIITEIDPSYNAYPDQVFINLYNKVYLETRDSESVISNLKQISSYQELLIQESINYEAINQLVNKNTIVFELMISIIMVSIILVMITTFKLYFDSKRFEEAILSILGYRKNKIIRLTLLELFIFIVIGFTISLFLTSAFMRYALLSLASQYKYSLGFKECLLALLVGSSSAILSMIIINHRKPESLNQKVKASKPIRFISNPSFIAKWWGIALFITLVCYIIDKISPNEQFLIPLIVSIFSLLLVSLMMTIVLLSKMMSSKKKFSLYMQMMIHEKAYLLLTVIVFFISIAIMLLVHANRHLTARIDQYEDDYVFDIMMTNISTPIGQLKTEVESLPDVENIEAVFNFQNIIVEDRNISRVISIDPEKINFYFNLEISEEAIYTLKNSTEPTILLPMMFHESRGYEVGDSVNINLNANYKEISFIIGGFFDKINDNIAFIHHMNYDELDDIGYNTLLINSKNHLQPLEEELLINYSKHMITIMNREDIFSKTIYEMRQIIKLMNILLTVIAISFVLAAINYALLLYQKMESNLTKLRLIGYTKKSIISNAILESIIQCFIILIFSWLSYFMIIHYLTRLTILIGDYEIIYNDLGITVLGVSITYLIILFVRLFYLWKIGHKEQFFIHL